MIGNNQLILNKATINKAVQEYLNARFVDEEEVVVTDVTECGNTNDGFRVSILKEVPSGGEAK